MTTEKKMVLFVLTLILSASLIHALAIQAAFETISGSIINDQDKPAVFDITLTNKGAGQDFEIYTFERVKIEPSGFFLAEGESKKIRFEFYPLDSMKRNVGHVPIPLSVRSKSTPQDISDIGSVTIKLVNFDYAFELKPENINPDADSFKVYLYNLEDIDYTGLDVVFSSVFTDNQKQTIELKPFERKEISIPISRDKIKSLVAGEYTLQADFSLNGKTADIKVPLKILEKSGLSSKEYKSGILIREYTLEKFNEGNIMSVADVHIRKNIISRLFSTFSLEPVKVERNGLFVDYYWQKELGPNQKLSVSVTTNWIFPFVLIVLIVIIGVIANLYMKQDLTIEKKVGFVKTKTSDFALKVVIKVKANKFAENIRLYDRLPGIAKLYEQFGEQPVAKDSSGRLQWNIPHLAPGEERIFSYIFYSKINVIGKFELPSATALYDIEGKPKSSKSNSVFFINEPRKVVNTDF